MPSAGLLAFPRLTESHHGSPRSRRLKASIEIAPLSDAMALGKNRLVLRKLSIGLNFAFVQSMESCFCVARKELLR